MRRLFLLGALGMSLTIAGRGAPVAAGDLEARRKALQGLLAEQWEYTLSHSPEFASILGDKRWNDRLSDFSQEEIDRDLAQTKVFLSRFEAIDPAGFPEQEALTRTLLIRSFGEQLEDARFRNWEMPVSQISGIHLQAPQLVQLLPFDTVKDYDDYVSRLRKLPTLFDQTTIQMRKGMAEGLMPPRFLLEKVAAQCEGIAADKAEDSPFAQPLKKFPKDFPEGDRARLSAAVLAAIRETRAPGVREVRRLRQERVRAEGPDRAGDVVASGRRGPLRGGGEAPDDDRSDARADPPDRPRAGRVDRETDARDREEAGVHGPEELLRRDRKGPEPAREVGRRDSGAVPQVHRADETAAPQALRPSPEGRLRRLARREVPREGGRRRLL